MTVVVPCKDEERYIGELLSGLVDQHFPGLEIVIADGRSTDRSRYIVEMFATQNPQLRIRVVDNPLRNIPSGLNRAIAEASGEIIVRLDAHCRPAAGYLERSCAALDIPGVQVAGGVWEIRPGGPGPTAEAIALAVSSGLGAGGASYRMAHAQAADVDTVPFGCFRRETWRTLGGYNEALLANEDYEFNFRVRSRGGRVYLDPRIRSTYFARSSVRTLARQYWRYGWWKAQMLRQYPKSLRARQAVPAVWAIFSLLLLPLCGVSASFVPVMLIAWSAYLLLLIGASLGQAPRVRPAVWLRLPGIWATIHFAWGLGFWFGLVRRIHEHRKPAAHEVPIS